MLGRENCAVVSVFFLFGAAFTGRGLSFSRRCKLTEMNIQYTDIVNRVLPEQRSDVWAQGELMMPRSENEVLKPVVERVFASHCPSGLFISQFHLLHHSVEDWQRSGGISFTDARSFDHFLVLIKQSSKTKL